jgi:hypothetical protein
MVMWLIAGDAQVEKTVFTGFETLAEVFAFFQVEKHEAIYESACFLGSLAIEEL